MYEPGQEPSPVATQITVIALYVLGVSITIKELLDGVVVDQPVRLNKVGQATDGEVAIWTFKAFNADFTDLTSGICAAPLIIVKVLENMEPAAPRAGFGRSHTPMGHLLNIFLNRLPVHLHYHLHAAGE